MSQPHIRTRLQQASPAIFSLYAICAAFGTYACMYAFRKAWSAGGFEGLAWAGIDYKIALVIAQTIGYAAAKFIGIKVMAEMKPRNRPRFIVGLILAAELFLLGFALVPAPWSLLCFLGNGLSLGMIWGLVFSYLEGRTTSDLLGTGLSVSFVVASGWVKQVGKWLVVDLGLTEFWMPVATGALFFLPMLGFVYLLHQIPPPSARDEAERTRRAPMSRDLRRRFVREFLPGLVLLIFIYMFLTAFRGVREDFANEIFTENGLGATPSVFSRTEMPIALAVLGVLALTMLLRNNLHALLFNHGLIVVGMGLIAGATWAFQSGQLSVTTWMILIGLGGHMGYIPFNCILFDRLIAAFRWVGNAVFLIYLADAFGYVADIGLKLYKSFGETDLGWTEFLTGTNYVMAGVVGALAIGSGMYFWRKHQRGLAG